MGEFNVNKSDGSLERTAGMPSEYPATQVMLSDGVTSVEGALDANTLGTGVSLTYDTVFTAPSDGYVNAIVTNGANQYVTIYLIGTNNAEIFMTRGFASTNNGGITALYVKKGMKVKFIGTSSSVATAAFYPLQ